MLDDIPQELRSYAQWVCWRYESRNEKETKIPYDVKNGNLAAVDDPTTFATFEQACTALSSYNGLGFVLTEHDPFTFVDLDIKPGVKPEDISRQISIQEKFDTYSERSPSGQGLHIICKGHVLSGRRRSNIEIYSSLRYMTVTGDVYERKPIEERQDLIQILWSEMGVGTAIYSDQDSPQTVSDTDVIQRGTNAVNGAKFLGLMQGNWQEYYPPPNLSQSEADFALIDMIAFYTQNREQIIRIFRSSGLGQRKKAQRVDYINTMVNRSFDRMLPSMNFDSLRNRIDAFVSGWKGFNAPATINGTIIDTVPFTHSDTQPSTWEDQPQQEALVGAITPIAAPAITVKFPPGLMGEIASYIYQSSQRPVAEIALAAGIGFMAGMCGRAYNTPTGAGLNLYIVLIALSGVGKEAMANGISRLTETIATYQPKKENVPSIREFIGPSEFRSDAALVKALERQPSMVSIMGEFGLKLQAMHSPNANAHIKGLKSNLLDVFSKSGYGGVFRPIVYSETAKNTKDIASPAFSILAESTPSTFYEGVDESMIAHGLLPRFLTLEYHGDRVAANETHTTIPPSTVLQTQLGQLAAYCHSLMHSNSIIYAQFADQDVYDMAKRFDKDCDYQINSRKDKEQDAIRELWNRGHLKALKLASLVSVGIDPYKPLITRECWEWSQSIVEQDILRMVKRFEKGDIGSDQGEQKQIAELLSAMREFLFKPWNVIAKYKVGSPAMQLARVIPHSFISKRLIAMSSFRKDRRGASQAINATLKTLCESGILADMTGKAQFEVGGRIYMITDTRYLTEPEA